MTQTNQQRSSAQNSRRSQNVPAQRPQSNQGQAIARLESNPLLMATDQWQRLESLALRFYKSGCAPKCLANVEAVLIVMLKGNEMGLPPMYAAENIAVVNGKATIGGQAMLRLIYERARGVKVEFHTEPAKQNTECEISIQRPGHEPVRLIFTMEDAKRAGLASKQPWQQYPRMMLRWRAVAECARIAVPDVIAGLYLHEELGANVDAEGNIVEAEFTRVKVEAKPAEAPSNVVSIDEVPQSVLEAPESAFTAGETIYPPAMSPQAGELMARYRIPFKFTGMTEANTHKGKLISEIPVAELATAVLELGNFYHEKGLQVPQDAALFIAQANDILEKAAVST